MKKLVYIDTETTDLKPGQIGQLSYIIGEEDRLYGKNMYFTVDFVSPEAEKVTGMGVDFYRRMSGGLKFADRADEIKADLAGATFVAHNAPFDRNFIDMEFWRIHQMAGYADVFDTMRYFCDILKLPGKRGKYKFPKLSEVGDWLNINQDKVLAYAREVYNTNDKITFHDARFDTTMMMICMRVYLEKMNGDFSKGWSNTFSGGNL